MITLFSCPKAFKNQFDTIQRNAIESWLSLGKNVDIVLVGQEEGMEEVCKEYKIKHIRNIERNEYGTPLVKSIVTQAENNSENELMCYVNADIVILKDFIEAINVLEKKKHNDKYLLTGRRWDLLIEDRIKYNESSWEADLKDRLRKNGRLDAPTGLDYFVYKKGMWASMPRFALGRNFWDQWFIHEARINKIVVVDGTPSITIIHQHHDYSHLPNSGYWLSKGPETKNNFKLSGGVFKLYNIFDATETLENNLLVKNNVSVKCKAILIRIKLFVVYTITYTLYPYSLPLIQTYKVIRYVIRKIAKLF